MSKVMKPNLLRKAGCLLMTMFLMHGCTYDLLFWECNIWQEFHGVFAIEEPDNMELYGQMLPEQFTIPEDPMVGMFIVDYFDLEQWPITPTKWLTPYLESALFLYVDLNGTKGWYCAYMAVTTEAAQIGGIRLGFPKIIADSITFKETKEGWIGSNMYKNKEHIGLRFESRPVTDFTYPSSRQLDFIQGNVVSDLRDTMMLLVPPAVGPKMRVFSCSPPPLVQRESGLISIHLGGPLEGLIAPGTISQGLYQHFSMGPDHGPSGPIIAITLMIILLCCFTLLLLWFIRLRRRKKRISI